MNTNNYTEKKHGGHFFNGFFWGAALGGSFAYVLSTKRGRDLIKDLFQDGLDMLDDLTMEPEMAEEELSMLAEPMVEQPVTTQTVEQGAVHEKKLEQPAKKRFFRSRKK